MVYSSADYVWVGVTFPLVAAVAVCVRFWVVRHFSRSQYGADDWLILAALVFALADGANLALDGIIGLGGRDYPGEIPPDRNSVEAKSDYAQVIIEKPLYGLVKLSVLFFFRRFFVRRPTFRILNNILIVLVCVWTLAYMFAEIFICGRDVWKVYTPNMHGTNNGCGDLNKLNFSYAITDTITDIMVIVLPYPFIRQLQMNRREKLSITAVFLLGTIATASSLVRLGVIAQAFSVGFGKPGNIHKSGAAANIFSTIEADIGIVAACLPPMAPLIRRAPVPKRLSKSLANVLPSGRRRSSAAHDDKHRDAVSRIALKPESQVTMTRGNSLEMYRTETTNSHLDSRELASV